MINTDYALLQVIRAKIGDFPESVIGLTIEHSSGFKLQGIYDEKFINEKLTYDTLKKYMNDNNFDNRGVIGTPLATIKWLFNKLAKECNSNDTTLVIESEEDINELHKARQNCLPDSIYLLDIMLFDKDILRIKSHSDNDNWQYIRILPAWEADETVLELFKPVSEYKNVKIINNLPINHPDLGNEIIKMLNNHKLISNKYIKYQNHIGYAMHCHIDDVRLEIDLHSTDTGLFHIVIDIYKKHSTQFIASYIKKSKSKLYIEDVMDLLKIANTDIFLSEMVELTNHKQYRFKNYTTDDENQIVGIY